MSEGESIAAAVRADGWYPLCVAGAEDRPPFLYTIGLCATYRHPEFIVFGLAQDLAYEMAQLVVQKIGRGDRFVPPGPYEGILRSHAIAVRGVHHTQHPSYLGDAVDFYRELGDPEQLTAVQLFWADPAGRYPFEAECDPVVARHQPKLALPAAAWVVRGPWSGD